MLGLLFASSGLFASEGVVNLVFSQILLVLDSVKPQREAGRNLLMEASRGVKTVYWELNVETDGDEGICSNKC